VVGRPLRNRLRRGCRPAHSVEVWMVNQLACRHESCTATRARAPLCTRVGVSVYRVTSSRAAIARRKEVFRNG
jgi:hypothetical protein